jgi:ABC-2 type transport system ATP-binding protein
MNEDNIMIKVTNLVKKYHGFTAVDSISFQVKKGEIFAFLGPNGAGKTTTIKMLTTLLTPTSGEIKLNGFDPTINQDDARKSFGIVFQDPSLDDELTALENLELHQVLYSVSDEVARVRIPELMGIVELWDRRNNLVKTFSGGMKRRLEIARGLLHHPTIFFLDEPTQGLDPQTRNRMWEYVLKLNNEEQITVFFTTHYIEEAEKIANKVAIIDHGKIIIQGTSVELKTQTNQKTLEDAFLQITGHAIRDETVNSVDNLRMHRRMFHRH